MNYKFTADGRKVAIIGALNANETIVQEIFVTDGTEFPAGEHFVVKTLLDVPAESYKKAEERRALENIKRLEYERDKLQREIDDYKFKAKAAAAKIRWVEGVTESEIEEVIENMKAIMCGDYTHVVFQEYGSVSIKGWDHQLFARADDYNRDRFESLRLISLYGEWNGRLSMSWRVNGYNDGSGNNVPFFPCRSYQEAVEKAKEIIGTFKHLSDENYEFCLKYGIPVDEAKNAVRLEKKSAAIKERIAITKRELIKLETELAGISRTNPYIIPKVPEKT